MGERHCSMIGCLGRPARGSVFCKACTAQVEDAQSKPAACNADSARATALALRDLAAQQQPHAAIVGSLTASEVHELCVAFLGGCT